MFNTRTNPGWSLYQNNYRWLGGYNFPYHYEHPCNHNGIIAMVRNEDSPPIMIDYEETYKDVHRSETPIHIRGTIVCYPKLQIVPDM